MKKFITALKRIRLGQILTIFLAGILLVVSTACSNAGVQASDRRQDVPAGLEGTKEAEMRGRNPRPEVPSDATTSSFKRGMNDFSDVDPRTKSDVDVSGKAKALIDNAQRNVIDQTGDVGENTKRTLDKKGENLEDLGGNLKRNAEGTKNKAQGTAEDLAKGAKRGVENVKNNTLDATKDLTRSANRAAEDVKQNVKQNTPNTRNLTRSAERATDDATQNTKETGKNLVEKAQQAIENTADFVQGKVNETAKSTQRSLDKAGNAID